MRTAPDQLELANSLVLFMTFQDIKYEQHRGKLRTSADNL